MSSPSVVELQVHIDFDGCPNPEIGEHWNLRAHLWTDGAAQPMLGESAASADDECAWVEMAVTKGTGTQLVSVPTGGRPFTRIYVEILADWLADDERAARRARVPGEGRASAVVELEALHRMRDGPRPKLLPTKLVAHWADDRECGMVHMRLNDSKANVSAIGSRFGDFLNRLMGTPADVAAAGDVGRALAKRCVPLRGVEPLSPGMESLNTTFWNCDKTMVPGFAWMLSMPWAPDAPEFLEGIVRAAASRRGIMPGDVDKLAAAALDDIFSKNTEKPDAPQQETIRFAILVAEAAYLVASSVHYMTDMVDTNTYSWRQSGLQPVERMSAQLRLSRAGDCEDYAREVSEVFRSLTRTSAPDRKVLDAASAVARCYIPLAILGLVDRPEGSDPQYETKDHLNAHSWAMLLGTAGARAAAGCAPRDFYKNAVQLDGRVCLDPWEKGLPTLLVDGTQARELTPRTWTAVSDHDAIASVASDSPAAANVLRHCQYAAVTMPQNLAFYHMLRNAYVPYGLVSATDKSVRAYEVYFYTNPLAHDVRAMKYGAPMEAVMRLPAARADLAPLTDAPTSRAEVPKYAGGSYPAIMATADVAPQELRAMRAILTGMHPLPPYSAPTFSKPSACTPVKAEPQQLHEGAAYVAAFVSVATKAGLPAVAGDPPPAADPWKVTRNTIILRYAEAKDTENLEDVVETMLRNDAEFKTGGKKVYARPQVIVAGEPQLWLTIA